MTAGTGDHAGLSPLQLVACRAVDVLTGVSRRNLAKPWQTGKPSVLVSRRDLLALRDAVERFSPGWIERTRDLQEHRTGEGT